jgi:Tetratricopeptide repeat
MTYMPEALAWTLLHFLWQATVIAVIYKGIDRSLSRVQASARYNLAVVALCFMLVTALATFVYEGWRLNSPQPVTNPTISSVAHAVGVRMAVQLKLNSWLRPIKTEHLFLWVDWGWFAGALFLSVRSYAFKGFGDYVSTTHDLLLFDKALYSGLILGKAMQEVAFTPAFSQVDRPNDDPFGLAWQIRADASLGKTVYHGGEATGLSCILLRNIGRHQTVILFDNTHSNAHQVADAALRILNGVPVPQPKKSVTKFYAQALLKEDPTTAKRTLDSLLADTADYAVDEDEMNDMGYALMESSNIYELPEVPHPQAALEVLKTNTELFPQSWNAWDSYGEGLRKAGRPQESIAAYERSLALNAGNESAKKALAEMR